MNTKYTQPKKALCNINIVIPQEYPKQQRNMDAIGPTSADRTDVGPWST